MLSPGLEIIFFMLNSTEHEIFMLLITAQMVAFRFYEQLKFQAHFSWASYKVV